MKDHIDITTAADVLIEMEGTEGFGGLEVIQADFPTIILHAPRKQAMKAFEFAISQDWPVESLSLVWRHKDKKVEPAFWKLDFCEQHV